MTVKSSLLEMLEKNKGEVLSGESIAGELGCTRAAVWKAVKSLREEGYHIEAGPNKGYMLAKDTNRLSQEGIRLFLDDPKVNMGHLSLPGARLQAGGAEAGNSILLQIQVFT